MVSKLKPTDVGSFTALESFSSVKIDIYISRVADVFGLSTEPAL